MMPCNLSVEEDLVAKVDSTQGRSLSQGRLSFKTTFKKPSPPPTLGLQGKSPKPAYGQET